MNVLEFISRTRKGRPPEHSPGETHAPFIGNERTAPRALRRMGQMMARAYEQGEIDENGHLRKTSASFSAFADELSKIAYVPNTQGDQAGVWRSLLASLVGKSQDHAHSTHMLQEELTRLGPEASDNYAHTMQAAMSENLLRDSRLQAAIEAQQGAATRSII